MTPEKWLEDKIGLEMFRGGFERITKVLAPYKTSFKQRHLTIFTIGGTNGKGQTAFELETLLRAAGQKTALWTSPHILRVSERFRFNGQEVSEQSLLAVFERLSSLPEHRDLSYYEFLLLCFCELVADHDQLDCLIFEVGLGGRLDGVNAFDANFTAITSISLDHTELLGKTTPAILREKWGISRSGAPMVIHLEQEELRELANSWAQDQSVPLTDLREMGVRCAHFREANHYTAAALFAAYRDGHQHKLAQYVQQLRTLAVQSPGRFEEMTLGALRFIFIGSHNPDGLAKLGPFVEALTERERPFDCVFFSFSKRAPDELLEGVKAMASYRQQARDWFCCLFHHPKAVAQEDLERPEIQSVLESFCREGVLGLEERLTRLLRRREENQRVLVTGSYYFISEVQKIIHQASSRPSGDADDSMVERGL